MMRELRSAVTVVLGMFVSLLVIMLGFDSYVMCEALKTDNTADTHYEYMYLLKFPDKEVTTGGESAYVKTLSTEFMGNSLDVTVIGLNEESKYFDARPEKGKNKIVVNNSLVERYGYKKGDKVTFTDSADDSDYSFTVTDTTQYSPGFTGRAFYCIKAFISYLSPVLSGICPSARNGSCSIYRHSQASLCA